MYHTLPTCLLVPFGLVGEFLNCLHNLNTIVTCPGARAYGNMIIRDSSRGLGLGLGLGLGTEQASELLSARSYQVTTLPSPVDHRRMTRPSLAEHGKRLCKKTNQGGVNLLCNLLTTSSSCYGTSPFPPSRQPATHRTRTIRRPRAGRIGFTYHSLRRSLSNEMGPYALSQSTGGVDARRRT